ncbi:MAG: hypothetical protein KKB50_17785 [Planctomycetes bacterium]|nr:hypothetical protein [Planctomycetota bacterium]
MRPFRRHLQSLGYAILALSSLVLALSGMISTSVQQEMQRRAAVQNWIAELSIDPQNAGTIAAELARIGQFEAECAATWSCAGRIGRREPLLADVFPAPHRLTAGFEFSEAYEHALARLLSQLAAGEPPNEVEVAAAQVELAAQRAARGEPPDAAPRASPASIAPASAPQYDPWLWACVQKARRIRCYVSKDSLHISPIVDGNQAPGPAEMWCAQVGLWIQQDVVAAIAGLNHETVASDDRSHTGVEHSAVKRLVALRIVGYETARGLWPIPIRTSPGPPACAGRIVPRSFTTRVCNAQRDVVRFALVVVVDQRDLLALLDRICQQGFYQCVGASYASTPPEDAAAGYLYGPEPVVRATLDFEAYLLRAHFRELMPTYVAGRLGHESGD